VRHGLAALTTLAPGKKSRRLLGSPVSVSLKTRVPIITITHKKTKSLCTVQLLFGLFGKRKEASGQYRKEFFLSKRKILSLL
jgi:hypothetical protein